MWFLLKFSKQEMHNSLSIQSYRLPKALIWHLLQCASKKKFLNTFQFYSASSVRQQTHLLLQRLRI